MNPRSLGLTFFISFWAIGNAAFADRLLIERNARPLLAEGSFEALQPWETPIEGFFVRSHHNDFPVAVSDSWVVRFEGLIKKNQAMSVRDLKRRKVVSIHSVLECSGNGRGLFSPPVSGIQWKRGAVGNAEWTGVLLQDVLRDLGVSPEAQYVTVEGYDKPVIKSDAKFVRSIPIKLLLENNAMLAWGMNRVPMPIAHGGPLRLVIPGIYGHNWIKWVEKMTFTQEPDQRLYAKKAYRMPDQPVKPGEAWDPVKQGKPVEYIKVQTIFTSHEPGARIAAGKVTLSGKAFTGKGHVEKVEISMDRGQTWQLAKLEPIKDNSWQRFEFDVDVREGVTYEAIARATDSEGQTQPMEQEWNPKGYLYNAVERLTFYGDAAGARLAEGGHLATVYCQTCHSIGMAESQRLTKPDWIKTVKKMADYGLTLADGEVEKIANYFAAKFPPGMPLDETRRVDLAYDPSQFASPGTVDPGNGERGGRLFKTHCASCHGAKGDGGVGPLLRGRAITAGSFWSTLTHGKRVMPAFSDRLTVGQMADIRAWLER